MRGTPERLTSYQSVGLGAVAGDVLELGHILFQVDALDADACCVAVELDIEVAVEGDGVLVLGDLVALHEVGVGVVLAVEAGGVGDGAVEGQAGGDGVLDGTAVDDGEDAGHAQADGADVGVGRRALVARAARAEHLALGEELDVDFQPYDGLIFQGGPRCGG